MKNFIYGIVACLIMATMVFVVYGVRTSDMYMSLLGISIGTLAVVLHAARAHYDRNRSKYHLRKSY